MKRHQLYQLIIDAGEVCLRLQLPWFLIQLGRLEAKASNMCLA